MLSAVFRFHLPSLSSHPVIRDLLRSFCLTSVERQLRPPARDLPGVLRFLNASAFEPLSRASLRALTQKVLLLLALATAKRVGELQALSSVVTFVGGNACLSYIPQFVAKSESLTRSIPRSFLVKSLSDLRPVLMMTSCFALCGHSAFIWTGLILYAIVSLCLLVAPLAPYRRMRYYSSWAMSLPQWGRLDPRWVPYKPMTSGGPPPLSRFTVIGLSPWFWSPPLGAPVRCSPHFIFTTFKTNTMAFVLWVRLWLRV